MQSNGEEKNILRQNDRIKEEKEIKQRDNQRLQQQLQDART